MVMIEVVYSQSIQWATKSILAHKHEPVRLVLSCQFITKDGLSALLDLVKANVNIVDLKLKENATEDPQILCAIQSELKLNMKFCEQALNSIANPTDIFQLSLHTKNLVPTLPKKVVSLILSYHLGQSMERVIENAARMKSQSNSVLSVGKLANLLWGLTSSSRSDQQDQPPQWKISNRLTNANINGSYENALYYKFSSY